MKFSVVTYESHVAKNVYKHWSKGLTMLITKDNVTVTLTEKEIQKLVESLPRTMGGTY